MEVIYIQNGKKRIYGEMRKPEGTGPFPLLVYSHGYGYNYIEFDLDTFPEYGIAVYNFDFCGGSAHSRSGGDSREMSVLSEADELEAVVDYLKNLSYIDENNIYLTGNSQGGYVSTVVGCKNPDIIKKLFLLCPAYVIDDFRKTEGTIKGQMRFGNMIISEKYLDDAESYDLYKNMKKFKNKVKIYHGTDDRMVPIEYSRKALKYFPDADLIICEGAGHMLGYTHGDKILNDIIGEIL